MQMIAALVCCCATMIAPSTQEAHQVIYENDFKHGLDDFFIEAEEPGTVRAEEGVLSIDVPAGCTVWLRQRLAGPVVIAYEAVVVSKGGPNDRVSDLNCFWMAFDPKNPDDLFSKPRGGKFAEYNTLRTYYVGVGGNANTTTRFRRYIGDAENRPLLPEHDLREPPHLLVANQPQKIRLVADGSRIEFWRDGQRVFHLDDAEPYTSGWFGFRTVASHLEIRNLRVTRPGE